MTGSSMHAETRGVSAFVLAGGLGSRLAGVREEPKSIVPVCGLPFLFYLLGALGSAGFTRVFLLLGRGAGAVQRRLGLTADGAELSPLEHAIVRRLEIVPIVEAQPLGTGGAITAAAPHHGASNLVLNGDSYLDLDLAAFVAEHLAHPDPTRVATIAAAWQGERSDYGGLDVDDRGAVTGFLEKGCPGAGWIHGGLVVFGRETLRSLPSGVSSLEHDLLPALARAGTLHAFRTRGFFRDIGTPERLREAEEAFVPLRRRLEG